MCNMEISVNIVRSLSNYKAKKEKKNCKYSENRVKLKKKFKVFLKKKFKNRNFFR